MLANTRTRVDCAPQVMQHCLQYLLLYGALLGLLAAAYACYQLQDLPIGTFAHSAAALTAGRPVFGCIGWLLINQVHRRTRRGSLAPTPLMQRRAGAGAFTSALSQARTSLSQSPRGTRTYIRALRLTCAHNPRSAAATSRPG